MFEIAKDGLGFIREISKGLIGHFFPNKDEQIKKIAEVERMIINGEFKRFEKGYDVMLAEAKSSDKFTSRARPSFMYVMYIMILASIPLGALFVYNPKIAHEFIEGVGLWFKAIPGSLYGLFGLCFTAYTGARSYDKGKLLKTLTSSKGA